MALQLIDDHAQFAVVYKPANVATHQQGDSDTPALTALLRSQFPGQSYYPVHRLDKVTSGLLILAKTEAVNSALSQMFAARRVSKIYIALANRKPSRKQGLIKGDMAKTRDGCWKLARTMAAPAVTQFFSYGAQRESRLFVLKPYTGKTHQLRVAMKSLGAPILGDDRYGGDDADRCYLHAMGLSFQYAGTTYRYSVLPREGDAFVNEGLSNRLQQLGDLFELPWPTINVD